MNSERGPLPALHRDRMIGTHHTLTLSALGLSVSASAPSAPYLATTHAFMRLHPLSPDNDNELAHSPPPILWQSPHAQPPPPHRPPFVISTAMHRSSD
ncbi:hypothetical protein CC85DRAFT_171070 [Cutaneotrichosporon oleaginosum]|uniref:Uncharacterized protein n=1 Tax=Cutaneotrichosporon oleaginosum TaxID=879819 RepID=A0A0J0XVH6_9TREE|nr:uncharacterized protein CC85DRAFT_171070 [Cutaneotrichosporon oleaginosum]KLT45072.1 hypothetical protein CC85DRAFT_171070 [Cutaneotrichosporon oleaginosum]TXT09755.1 hypothetical protein COLE_03689 [Cutaneotrichosporon oleaginosum]